MTTKDEELISLLRLNAREPVAALARKLGVSRTTVQDRLKRLESDGTIAGYAVKLGRDRGETSVAGLITLGVEPKKQIDVANVVAKIPHVETLFAVSGKFDFVAMVRTTTLEQIDQLIDRIGMLPGVTEIETSVILSTKVDRR